MLHYRHDYIILIINIITYMLNIIMLNKNLEIRLANNVI